MTVILPLAVPVPAAGASAASAASAAAAAAAAQPAAFAASLATALESAGPPAGFITLGQMTGTTGVLAPGALPPAPLSAGATATPGGLAGGAQVAARAAAGGRAEPVIAAAERYLGVPYRWGGTNPSTGLDCSGFVQRVFADLGVQLPRVSVDQARQGTKVASLAEARPGDLVFRRGSPNHIGIYLGDGQFIHAPRTGDVVKVAPLRWTPDEIRRVT